MDAHGLAALALPAMDTDKMPGCVRLISAHELISLVEKKIINIPEARRLLLGEGSSAYPEPDQPVEQRSGV